MNAQSWTASVLALSLVLSFQVQAAEPVGKTPNDLRQEVLELKRLVMELSARLEKIERQLSQWDQQAQHSIQPAMPLHRLGSHLMVDQNGTIWEAGRAVGIWGVNGGGVPANIEMPPSPRHFRAR